MSIFQFGYAKQIYASIMQIFFVFIMHKKCTSIEWFICAKKSVHLLWYFLWFLCNKINASMHICFTFSCAYIMRIGICYFSSTPTPCSSIWFVLCMKIGASWCSEEHSHILLITPKISASNIHYFVMYTKICTCIYSAFLELTLICTCIYSAFLKPTLLFRNKVCQSRYF